MFVVHFEPIYTDYYILQIRKVIIQEVTEKLLISKHPVSNI